MMVLFSYLLSSVLSLSQPTEALLHRELITFARDGLQFDTGLRLQWADASPDCQLMALPPQPGEAQRVLWQNVYPNADLTVITYATSELITYEWVIYPGGLVEDIAIESLYPHGRPRGESQPQSAVQFSAPEAWQDQGGISDKACPVSFRWQGSQLHVELGDYEPAQVLTIRWTQSS